MIYLLLLLASSIPTGYFLAWVASDELKTGRKWFILLIILFALVACMNWQANNAITYTSVYIMIVSIISLIKSKK